MNVNTENLLTIGIFTTFFIFGLDFLLKIKKILKDNQEPFNRLSKALEENTLSLTKLSERMKMLLEKTSIHEERIAVNHEKINENKNEITELKIRISNLEKD